MTKNEKQVLFFLLFVLCAGLLSLLLARYRFYEDFVSIEEKTAAIEKTGLTERTISTDIEERERSIIKRVNINEATFSELTTLPGVGRETALKIIEYRTTVGDFTEPDDLIRVKGIGEKKLAALRPYISTD